MWLLRDFRLGSNLPPIKARMTVAFNKANKYEETISTYKDMVIHLSRGYDTDAVIAMEDGEIRNFQKSPLTPCDVFQELWT